MQSFLELIKGSVEKFRKLNPGYVRIISHLDTDGLCSAAILISAMQRANIGFAISVVTQLDEKIINGLRNENCDCIIFADLGSTQLNYLLNIDNKEVLILDHHKPRDIAQDLIKSNITHINPHLFKIDGGYEISGAGVSYLFAKGLDEKNTDLAHLAILGAIGDFQDKNGFSELNNRILQDAVASKRLVIKTGLKMFGVQTRPLGKVLQYSTDPYIPGITGFENASNEFLKSLGINPQRKLAELDREELKKLVTAIVMQRMSTEQAPDDVLGAIYILNSEPDDSPTRDLREFSTLLNATGRLRKPALGIGACLNDDKLKKIAIQKLYDYKKEILESLNWFYQNRKNNAVIEGRNYVIINGGDNIKETIAGILAMMLCKSNLYKQGTYVIALAHNMDNEVKISLRIVGNTTNIDLREILKQILDNVGGGEMGGHRLACGGIVKQEIEDLFIASAKEVFDRLAMESSIS